MKAGKITSTDAAARRVPPYARPSELHVAVAPELPLDQTYSVPREPDDTDEDHARRARILAAVLDCARRG